MDWGGGNPSAGEYWIAGEFSTWTGLNEPKPRVKLMVWKQRRDDFTQSATVGSPPATTDQEAGRSHLAIDPNGTQTTYLCWTRRKPLGADSLDDSTSVAHELGDAWGSVTERVISTVANRIDDHCSQAVASSGKRYTVYHSANVNAQGQPILSSHQLALDIDQYNATTNTFTTLTNDLVLTLPTIANVVQRPDFPVIYEDVGKLLLVAQDVTNDTYLLWWTCDITSTGCDAANEWTTGAWDVTGAVRQPQPARFGDELYAIWENGSGAIGVGAWCAGGSGWWYAGTAMQFVNYTDNQFGTQRGSATRVLWHDDVDDELVATWLTLGPVTSPKWSAVKWEYDGPCGP